MFTLVRIVYFAAGGNFSHASKKGISYHLSAAVRSTVRIRCSGFKARSGTVRCGTTNATGAAETATIEYSEHPVDRKILKKRRKKHSSSLAATYDYCTTSHHHHHRRHQELHRLADSHRSKRRDIHRQQQQRNLSRQLRERAVEGAEDACGSNSPGGSRSNTTSRPESSASCCRRNRRNHSNGPVVSANGSRRNMTTDTRRRVKLYALNADRQWDDRGTGHVTSSYVDRVKGKSSFERSRFPSGRNMIGGSFAYQTFALRFLFLLQLCVA